MKSGQNFPAMRSDSISDGLPFAIRTISWMDASNPESLWQPHCHNYFEMIWIIKGSGTIWIDLQRLDIGDNQVFCIRPGQVHQLHPDNDTDGYVLSFAESFLNMGEYEFDLTGPTSFFQLFNSPGGIAIKEATGEDMEETVAKMTKEFENVYPFRVQVLRRYLKIFLIYLTREVEVSAGDARPTRDKELIRHFMNLLEKNFKEDKMVADYARHLSVTPNYLNEIVKKNTGYTAGHHIRQRVVLEAKRMGRYSGSCMKEIAYDLGFSDCGHFSKFFKSVTGMNFSDFKKEKLNMALPNG